MTERWLAEMKKVERLGPTSDLLARAEAQPPRPVPASSMRSRVAAGLFAILIAVGGAWVAYAALNDGGRTSAGSASRQWGWPDTSTGQAQHEQTRVDGGEQQWRTDAAAVALRFGREVLGWPAPIAAVTSTDDPDNVVVSLHGPDASCSGVDCSSPPQQTVTLSLQRLERLGDGGIWSVTRVQGEASGASPTS